MKITVKALDAGNAEIDLPEEVRPGSLQSILGGGSLAVLIQNGYLCYFDANFVSLHRLQSRS